MQIAAPWTQFCALSETLGPSPGVREAWTRGRSRYAVWLLRVSDPLVVARAQAVAAALGDAIRPIPPADLHITLLVAGFPVAGSGRWDDDVPECVLAAQRAALRRARLPPLRLAVGGASSFATAPFLTVTDVEGTLARARSLLAAGVREIRFAPYCPHVTVGVYRDTRPAAPLREVLAGWRGLPPLAIQADAVELVTFDAQVEGAALETRWRVCCAP